MQNGDEGPRGTMKRKPPVQEQEDRLQIYRVVPEAPRIRALIYGEPGSGKTSLAASAQDHEEMAPVVFANIEGGLLSVVHRGDIHAVDITSTEDMYELYHRIKNKVDPFAEIKTLVIDNVTELQATNLEEIVQAEMVSPRKSASRVSEDEIFQEDYGTSTVQLSRLFRWCKGLDVNLILTAHAKFVYPPSRNSRSGTNVDVEPTAVLPMLTQKLMKSVMGLVDFVWYLQWNPEDKQRWMLTRPDGIYQAKTRGLHFAEALGPAVKDPSMPKLYDLLVKAESGQLNKEKNRGNSQRRKPVR